MWLTTEEIVELGITDRWARKKIASGEWEWRESGRRGRNGKPIREVLFSSLPSDLQWRWNQRQKSQAAIDEPDAPQAEVETDSSVNTLETLNPALKQLPMEEREAWLAEAQRLAQLVERYDAINPKRRVNPGTGKHEFVAAVLALCEEAICDNQVVKAKIPAKLLRNFQRNYYESHETHLIKNHSIV